MCIKNNVAINNSFPEGMFCAVIETINGDFSAKFGFPTYKKHYNFLGKSEFYRLIEIAIKELTGRNYDAISGNGLCIDFSADDCPEWIKLASSHSEPLSLIRQGYSIERVHELMEMSDRQKFTDLDLAQIEKEFGYEVYKTTADVCNALAPI